MGRRTHGPADSRARGLLYIYVYGILYVVENNC
jgi:hypothetical protein